MSIISSILFHCILPDPFLMDQRHKVYWRDWLEPKLPTVVDSDCWARICWTFLDYYKEIVWFTKNFFDDQVKIFSKYVYITGQQNLYLRASNTDKNCCQCQDLAATPVVHLVTLDLREVEGGWKEECHTALCTMQNPLQSLCKNIKEDLEFLGNLQHIKPFSDLLCVWAETLRSWMTALLK